MAALERCLTEAGPVQVCWNTERLKQNKTASHSNRQENQRDLEMPGHSQWTLPRSISKFGLEKQLHVIEKLLSPPRLFIEYPGVTYHHDLCLESKTKANNKEFCMDLC